MLNILERYECKIDRKSFIGYIKKIYDNRGTTRARYGIFAGDRAELYFRGEWKSVGYDSIDELAEKGTDIVFIEKKGIPEVMTEFADKYGIAMVNTRGYLTEYGNDLMSEAKGSGANVAIMTDYDLTGINIAGNTGITVPWIGINEDSFEYFNLDKNSSNISVEASNHKLLKSVRDKVRGDPRFSSVDIDFLTKRRVEIDSIQAKVGSERLFGYILDSLKKLYPKRDYNRAIELPKPNDFKKIYEKNLIGIEHEEFIELIETRKMDIMKPEIEKIEKELKEIEGFIEVEDKEKETKDRLAALFTNNPDYDDFMDKLKELYSHPFLNNNNNKSSD